MKTSFLIFISSLIRAYEYPRIDGFKHTDEFKDLIDADGKPLGERYVYQGRALTLEEFNAAAARVFSESFQGEDRTFRPFVIDPEAEAKHAEAKARREEEAEAARVAAEKEAADAEEAAAAAQEAEAKAARDAAEQEAVNREIARKSREAVLEATRKLDAENAAKAKAQAAGTPPPIASPSETLVEPAAFVLDDNRILLNGERVAGLYGDEKHLRVTAAHADLRPAIEAWLATQQP